MADNLLLKMVLQAKDEATAIVKKVRGSIDGMGDSADRAGDKTGKFAEKSDQLGQSLQRSDGLLAGLKARYLAIAAAGAAVVAAVRSLVRQAGEWIRLSNIQQRAETKLETTLRNLVGATKEEVQALKDQASALQNVTGYGDEATISAQAMLGTFKLNAEEIGKLTPRLLDMAESARKTGQAEADLEQISIAVGKAFTDGLGSLKRYGVALTKAQEEAFKVASQQDKVAILTRVLDGNFQGLAAAVGDTYEGALRKAEAAQGDFGEVLGDQLTQNKEWISLQKLVKQSWEQLAEGIKGSSDDIGTAVSFLAGVIKVSFGAIRATWNTAQIAFKTLLLGINEGIELINRSMAKITFGEVSKDFQRAADKLKAKNQELRDSIGQDVAELAESGRTMLTAFDQAGEGAERLGDKTKEAGDKGQEAGAAIAAGMREAGEATGAAATQTESLRESLAKLGVDLEEINTGLTEQSRVLIENFTAVATSMEASAEVVDRAYQAAIDKADDFRTLTELTRLYNQALEEQDASAERAEQALAALQRRTRELEEEDRKAKATLEALTRRTGDLAEQARQLQRQYEAGEISRARYYQDLEKITKTAKAAAGSLEALGKVNTYSIRAAMELEQAYNDGLITLEQYTQGTRNLIEAFKEERRTAKESEEAIRNKTDAMEEGAEATRRATTSASDYADAQSRVNESIQYTDNLSRALYQVGKEAGLIGEALEGFVAQNLDAVWRAWQAGGGKLERTLEQLRELAELLAAAGGNPLGNLPPPATHPPPAPPAPPGLLKGNVNPAVSREEMQEIMDRHALRLYDGIKRLAERPVVATVDPAAIEKQLRRFEGLET
jgi:hypothetical protein